MRVPMLKFIRPAAVLAVVAAACSSDSDDPAGPPPPPITVSISPSTASVPAGGMQSFTASVANAKFPDVTWSASGGTIGGSGATITWTAPLQGGSYTITATSVEDPIKSGSASVTVSGASVIVQPAAATRFRGQPQTFTATVSGAAQGGAGVTWSTTCGTGVEQQGALEITAPTDPGTCTVTATSTLDPSESATATVTIRAE